MLVVYYQSSHAVLINVAVPRMGANPEVGSERVWQSKYEIQESDRTWSAPK